MLVGISALTLLLAAATYAQTPVWYNGVCGVSKYPDAGEYPLPESRRRLIVGGIEAQPNEFPWQVSMQSNANSHYCGGSIINEEWIVTASHCVDGDIAAQVQISAGEHQRSDANSPTRQRIQAAQLIMHPDYDSGTLENDLALVRLSSPLTINDDVRPVCAPDSGDLYTYRLAQCSGWGTLQSGGACCPQNLQYVTLNVTTNAYCNEEYNGDITSDMVCATDNSGSNERDSCQGDSGGPLTVKDADGTFRLIGAVSWGIGCASGWPGVYSRVSVHNDWITDTINSNK